ncbi:MAG: phage/plasmid replication protein [Patescibacteria group bacterium]
MIDTATIHITNFVTYSEEFFTKAKHHELKGKFGIFGRITTRYTDYPKHCASEGRYFPQVHIEENSRKIKGGYFVPKTRTLVIQASFPKLLFGTSIFDLDERLLPLAAQKLADTLKEIKVDVTVENILGAIVYRIDYSKILQISPTFGTTAQMLRALMPYDAKQSSDFNRRDYHDGGDGFYLKYFNSSQGFVLYDKFDEIVANGKTKLEQEIARQYKAGKWTKGALRIELSLQKKQTVDATLRQFSDAIKKKDYTLQEAAKTHIAKSCLIRTFESVYVKGFNRLVRLSDLKDVELHHLIEEYARDFRDGAVLYYLAHRVRDHGIKRVVADLKREASPATVTRYKKAVETVLAKVEAKKDIVGVVPYLQRKLIAFRPVLPKKLEVILVGSVADDSGEV